MTKSCVIGVRYKVDDGDPQYVEITYGLQKNETPTFVAEAIANGDFCKDSTIGLFERTMLKIGNTAKVEVIEAQPIDDIIAPLITKNIPES